MEILAWLGGFFVLALATVLFFVIRRHLLKVREKREGQAREEEAFWARFGKFYEEKIEPLPVSYFTYTLGYRPFFFAGEWTHYEREKVPDKRLVLTAAYYYLCAVESGNAVPRRFSSQAELVVFVNSRIRTIFSPEF